MKLVIDNRTGYLNDYYFQTLCLLYFPGEKFPASPAPDAPEAVVGFTGTPDGFSCTVRLRVNGRIADGAFSSAGYRFALPLAAEDRAQITAAARFWTRAGSCSAFCRRGAASPACAPPSAPAISLRAATARTGCARCLPTTTSSLPPKPS